MKIEYFLHSLSGIIEKDIRAQINLILLDIRRKARKLDLVVFETPSICVVCFFDYIRWKFTSM